MSFIKGRRGLRLPTSEEEAKFDLLRELLDRQKRERLFPEAGRLSLANRSSDPLPREVRSVLSEPSIRPGTSGLVGPTPEESQLIIDKIKQSAAETNIAESKAEELRQILFADFPFLAPEAIGEKRITESGPGRFQTEDLGISDKQREIQKQREKGAEARRSARGDLDLETILGIKKKVLDIERAERELDQSVNLFNNYELSDPESRPVLSNPEVVTLRDADAAVREGSQALSDSIDFVRAHGISVNPLTSQYASAIQLEKSLTDIFRRVQKAGANFTKNEEKIIDSIKGTLTGTKAKIRGADSAIAIFEEAKEILVRKADSLFESRGYKRKEGAFSELTMKDEVVRFTDPDGFVYEGSPEEAEKLKEAFAQMTPEQREDYRTSLGNQNG